MLRRLLRLTAVAMVGLVLLAVSGQPAQAGAGYPPCGPTCDNKNPATYKVPAIKPYWFCSAVGVDTVGWASTSGVNLELRYSAACETTWGRYTLTQWASPFYLRHESKYPSGGMRKVSYAMVSGSPWTMMLDDHNLLNRICIEQWWWDHVQDPPDEVSCTPWY